MATFKYIQHKSSGDVYAAEFLGSDPFPDAEPIAILGPIAYGDIGDPAQAFKYPDLYSRAEAEADADWIQGIWHQYARP